MNGIGERRAIQTAIANNIIERGYGLGELTPEQYAAKQLAISLQEIVEALSLFSLPPGIPPAAAGLFGEDAHRQLKDWFHDVEYWKKADLPFSHQPFLPSEVADAAIPLFNLAEQVLEKDLSSLARYKSERDRYRGVTWK